MNHRRGNHRFPPVYSHMHVHATRQRSLLFPKEFAHVRGRVTYARAAWNFKRARRKRFVARRCENLCPVKIAMLNFPRGKNFDGRPILRERLFSYFDHRGIILKYNSGGNYNMYTRNFQSFFRKSLIGIPVFL